MTTLPSFDAFLRSVSDFPVAQPTSPLRIYQCTKFPSKYPIHERSQAKHSSPTSSASNPSSWVSHKTDSGQDVLPTLSSPTTERRHRTRCIKAKRAKKKYLIEHQRCEIVCRVRQGEKQAHLAKEYGVSRAAVCYLLKHETEILQRWTIRRQHCPSSSPFFTSV